MGYQTYPTIKWCRVHDEASIPDTRERGSADCHEGSAQCDIVESAVVPAPDGLVLGWENCQTCEDWLMGMCDCALDQVPLRGPSPDCPRCLGRGTCPACFGAARFPVWMRECDWAGHRLATVKEATERDRLLGCPNGCVDVGGRRMIPVRNGDQI